MQASQPEQSGGPSHQPLSALREIREAAGLHIAALAAALKVPVRKLEALEAGRFDELPDLTFARALASSACRHLKADPKPVLDQIPMRRTSSFGAPPSAIGAPFKPSVPSAVTASSSRVIRPSMIVAGALVLGAVALLLLPELQRLTGMQVPGAPGVEQPIAVVPAEPAFPPATAPGAGLVEAPGNLPEPAAEPLQSSETEEGVPPSAAQPSNNGVAQAVGAPAAATAGPVAGSALAVAPPSAAVQGSGSGSILTIEATGESWVEVTNGAGAVVTQRLLRPGDVIEFSSTPPYKVVLGRAESARVQVRGQPFDVLPYARNSVARFEVR